MKKKVFLSEIKYLQDNGFNTSLIKVSPKCHVVKKDHIDEDKKKYAKTQGSTSRGIAPCYRDKYARLGSRVSDEENIDFFKDYLWDEKLEGNILCEGAQGYWLDINQGNYPYVTSSTTLPYGACSLGFATHDIKTIYGAAKIYDTRSGIDTDFPESLFLDKELEKVGEAGKEFGVTTGRKRKVNWLNLDKLCTAVKTTGTTHCIISKTDVLEKVGIYKLFYREKLYEFEDLANMKKFIDMKLIEECKYLQNIIYSNNVETIAEL